jgi:hypothetical protein
MFQLVWIAAGAIVGMLIACVLVPPTRTQVSVPSPYDTGIFHTDTGCVRTHAIEVPCGEEADSFNLLASLTKK